MCLLVCLFVPLSLSLSLCLSTGAVRGEPSAPWVVRPRWRDACYLGFLAELAPSDGDVVWVGVFPVCYSHATPYLDVASEAVQALFGNLSAAGGHISAVGNFANSVCLK